MAQAERRLHLNESPFSPSGRVQRAIVEAVARANYYPEHDLPALTQAISAYCGAPAARIVVSSGSNELLHLLPLIAEKSGNEMVTVDPCFPTFTKIANIFDLCAHRVPTFENGIPDIDAVLAAITPACRMVCVASPNNPTGGLLSGDAIEKLVHGVPSDVLLHFDEAYYEFGLEAGGVETLPILEQRKGPWLTTRSFSKAFGLAGLRLGYSVVSEPSLAARVLSVRPNFSVNIAAAAAGKAALMEQDRMWEMVAAISLERERLADGARSFGLTPMPSAANFLSFPVLQPAEKWRMRMAERQIRIGSFTFPSGREALRISVGEAADTDAFLHVLNPDGGDLHR